MHLSSKKEMAIEAQSLLELIDSLIPVFDDFRSEGIEAETAAAALHDYFLAGYCYLFGFLDSAEGSDTGAQEFRTTELFHRMFHWNI